MRKIIVLYFLLTAFALFSTDVLINGEDNATIIQGEDVVITIYFTAGFYEATGSMWADMNDNQIWEDTIDLDTGEPQYFVDNDEDDEDPDDGIYQTTMTAEEDGISNVGNASIFLVAEDGGGLDVAHLYIEPIVTDYSVSGSVDPALPNILVGAGTMNEEPHWLVMTDIEGNYQLYVPDIDTYYVISMDMLNVTGGMYTNDFYWDIYIDGHLIGFDFTYIAPTAWIQGTVLDDSGEPLVGYEVNSDQFGLHNWTITDENGDYLLGVMEGNIGVGMLDDELIPDYLVPEEVEVYVSDGGTETVNFIVYVSDAVIGGNVYLDDVPVSDIRIEAWSELGFSSAESAGDGSYLLHVSSEADQLDGYYINAYEIPPFTYVEESYMNILSGTENVDFHIWSVTGGINGYVYDSFTLEGINHTWIAATDGINWYDTATDETGFFELGLPNATYNIYVNAENYDPDLIPGVLIMDEIVPLEFYLEPIVDVNDDQIPIKAMELSNYPNPFNPSTVISYKLVEDSKVELSIYNVKGQLVRTLVNEIKPAGEHGVIWDGRDNFDQSAASGVYFYRLKTQEGNKIKKMILLR